jgi:hypothetical protein
VVSRVLPLLVVLSCAQAPLLVDRHCTEAPKSLGPAYLVRCTETACLYEYREQGIICTWELDRDCCHSDWDLSAHECVIYSPDDPKEWQVPE